MNNSIILCGDLCPTDDTEAYFKAEDPHALFNDCLPLFKSAGLTVGNLEFVLTDDPQPIKKSGPILYGPKAHINVLKKGGIDIFSLANNHIKDCGGAGVKSTIATCADAQIETFGAAHNLQAAKKPFIGEVGGKKIGFLAFAEQEFNTAGADEYGSSFFDPFEDLDLIEKTKKYVDYLIVIYHGGIEYYEYPSPMLQKKCRRFVDKGADLVTCQHSHCIGTIENYHNKDIVYGQGNTLFGYREGNDSWNEGIIIQLNLDGADLKINYLGVKARKEGGIRLMTHDENEILTAKLARRSQQIKDPGFIMQSWFAFCKRKESLYFPQYLALNRYFIHLNRWTRNRFVSLFYGRKYLRSSHNIIRCEAHNEVIQTILNTRK